MPNPLFSKQLNTGKRAAKRPIPTPPVMEDYEGDNNAYRGIEAHGVQPTDRNTDPAVEYDDNAEHFIDYEEMPETDPIPVRIVQGGSQERRDFRTFRAILPKDGTPVRIVGAMPGRTKVRILNNTPYNSGASNQPSALIGPDPSTVGNGGMNAYPLTATTSLELTAEGDIWGAVPIPGMSSTADLSPSELGTAAVDVRLSILIEFTVQV